eukprot:SAG11_NODE_19347_length_468_cov_2.010840_1_plen_51_part_10
MELGCCRINIAQAYSDAVQTAQFNQRLAELELLLERDMHAGRHYVNEASFG